MEWRARFTQILWSQSQLEQDDIVSAMDYFIPHFDLQILSNFVML